MLKALIVFENQILQQSKIIYKKEKLILVLQILEKSKFSWKLLLLYIFFFFLKILETAKYFTERNITISKSNYLLKDIYIFILFKVLCSPSKRVF